MFNSIKEHIPSDDSENEVKLNLLLNTNNMIYLTDMFPIVSDIENESVKLKISELNNKQQGDVFGSVQTGFTTQVMSCKETTRGLGLELELNNKRVVLEKDDTVYYVQTSHRLEPEQDLPKGFFYKMLKITLE